MTDEPEDPPKNEHETSDSDGEVEIEVTRGRLDDPSDEHGVDEQLNEHGSRGDPDGDRATPERDLADELGRIDVMTTPEGYVEGRITDVTSVDATTVRLAVVLPHGETASFTLEKPIPWSREFLLARLVEDVGYDAASIDHVVGERVSLQRTDLEPPADDEDDWWSSTVQAASDALLASLSGGRYRLETDTAPEWRLVDPLERPDATDEEGDETIGDLVGAGLVLLGTVLAAAGAVVGATSGLALSSAVVGYALVGLVVVLIGLAVLVRDDTVK